MLPQAALNETLARADALIARGALVEAERLLIPELARHGGSLELLRRLNAIFARLVPAPARKPLPPGEAARIVALYEAGDLPGAIAAATAANRAAPHQTFPLKILAAAHLRQQRWADALPHAHLALVYDPDDWQSWSYAAEALGNLEREAEAAEAALRVLAANPDDAAAAWSAGHALRVLGRTDEARAVYEAWLERHPGDAEVHRALGRLKRHKPGDRQVPVMERGLKRAKTQPERMHFHFALAKAHDDLGKVDTAFRHYAAGNRIKRKEIQARGVELVVKAGPTTAHHLRNRDTLAAIAPPDPNAPRPIFVVGMPRSGTSLTEQILASHSQVAGLGELSHMGAALRPLLSHQAIDKKSLLNLAQQRDAYLANAARRAGGAAAFVDKMPLNFRWVGYLAALFPQARFVALSRDPLDVGWSIFKQYFPVGNFFSFDFEDIAGQMAQYAEFMAFWRDEAGIPVFGLDYLGLIESQEETTRALLAACGLEWEPACLEFHRTARRVRTASDTQVRRKLNRDGLGTWRPYARHLRPLGEALAREGVIDTLPPELAGR